MSIKKTLFALQLDLLLATISHKELRYRQRRMKHYLYAGLLMAGCSMFSVNAQSATLTWNCSNNYWHTTTCWNPMGTPTSADIVNVYTVGGLDTLLKIDSTTGHAYANSLNVNATTGTTVTLQQAGGALSASNETIGYDGTGTFTQTGGTNTVTVGLVLGTGSTGNGSYDLSGTGALSASNEIIGNVGTGAFTQSSGTNTITTALYLGINGTGNGSYDLSGTGVLSAFNENIGYGGTGFFTQSGGTHTVTNNITLGELTGSDGRLTLSGGTLDVGGDIVGGNGTSRLDIDGGTLNVTGGDINVDTLYLGFATGSNGNYTVTGTDTVTVFNELIGYSGAGLFTQSGGTNTVTSSLQLGTYATGNGSYDLSGGALSANYEYIGNSGTGTFTQSGGTNTITNLLYLGTNATGNGSYNLSGTGTLSAGDERIGFYGTGLFTQSGGTNTVTTNLTLGNFYSGNGSYELSGGALSAGSETIGREGTGLFTQSGGTNTITNVLYLGSNSNGNGSYDLSGGALSASTAHIGNSGIGSLNISNGGVASSTDAYLAYTSSASGTATLSDTGSAWNNSNNLYVGGSNLSAGGSGTLTVNSGATVDVGNILKVWSTGIVDLNGGTINTGSLINEGSFNFNAGALNFTTDLIMDPAGPLGNSIVLNGLKTLGVSGTTTLNGSSTLTLDGGTFSTGSLINNGGFAFNSGTFNLTTDLIMDPAGPLGNSIVLNGLKTLGVSGTTTLNGSSTLTLDGGTFSTGSLINNGGFAFNSGTFNLTSDNLVIGAGGLFGSILPVSYGKTINVTNTTTVDAAGLLYVNGGSFSSGNLINNGQVAVDGLLSNIDGAISNNGLLNGDGRISAALSNNVGGEVQVGSGDTLRFTAAGNTNSGQINLAGGTARFDQDLTNNTGGVITGRGTLYANGGLTNQGNIGLSSGNTDLHGDINNDTGATIIVSGNATATFYDDLIHNGAEIRVSNGSTAVFFGAVSGTGSYTGSGSVFFEGDLNPGNSPALVSIEGDMGLGTNSHTLIEIGGLVQGDEYDAFNIGAELMFGGQLEVSFWDVTDDGLDNPFSVSLGDTFDIFSAESFSGQFDLLTLALLGDGLGWQLDYLVDEIGSIDIARLSVISASTVPVPPAVWLFGSGLIGLIVVARRRHIR